MEQSLTVVLPMHNCERQLRSSVLDILDLTSSASQGIRIVVVDDGSTDDTFEAACELARQYPQLTALRQPVRQGLGAALDLVKNRLAIEMVLVHDGVSAINVNELQAMLKEEHANNESSRDQVAMPNISAMSSGSRRFSSVRALHDRMEQAHKTATCFQWMQLEKPLVPRRCLTPSLPETQDGIPSTGAPVSFINLPIGMSPLPQI